MTSTVTVRAHCAKDKQVKIKIAGKPTVYIQDGEMHEDVVHGDQFIAVREVPRTENEVVAPAPTRSRPHRRELVL